MCARKMHRNELDTDVSLVHRLLRTQFPEWAHLPIAAVPSAGTDHALYRLGEDLLARLPRIDWALRQADKEREWLPRLANRLPVAIPVPLEKGLPGEGYPWEWSVYRWLPGMDATRAGIADLCLAAADLAGFVRALETFGTRGGPLADRGRPLAARDRATRKAILALQGLFDVEAAVAAWGAALAAPVWRAAPVWVHGDLLPGNLLFREGRLSAVIDFGGLGLGDPACDLMSAWALFSGESRRVFRAALDLDDATWVRAWGHVLSWAAIYIPYYLETNPEGVAVVRHTLTQVLADRQDVAGWKGSGADEQG